MVALLEVGLYTVVEVLDAAIVRTYVSDQRYQYCDCGPNVGLMGLKDLMVALGPDTSNTVVVVVDPRAMEVLKMIVLRFKVISRAKCPFLPQK